MKNIKRLFLFLIILVLCVGCGSENNKDDKEEAKINIICVLGDGSENKIVEVKANGYQLEAPTREGYDFVNWYSDEDFYDLFTLDDVDVTLLTKDISIYAYAKWTIKKFNVEFYADGVKLNKQTIEYGKSARAPQAPEKDGFNFDHWDSEFDVVKSDLTVNAVYVARPLTIIYYEQDGVTKITNLDLNEYLAGNTYELPVLTREGYEFEGWYLSLISRYPVKQIESDYYGDLKLYARFTELVLHNPITLPQAKYHFTGIKTTSNTGGTFTYQPIFPSGANLNVQAYDWTVSDDNMATVSGWSSITPINVGYCVLTATNKEDKTYTINCIIRTCPDGVFFANEEEANTYQIYTVTFEDDNGNAIKTQKVAKGGHALCPVPPTKEGYSFAGWDKDCYNIKADTVIKATYKENGENNYVGKKFAIIGDSITTYRGLIPDGYSCFYPYPTGDVFDYNQTWWMKVINKLGGLLLVNNAYSGSCVAVGAHSATNTDERLASTVVQCEKPDVIIIYMGSNDAASSSVSNNQFKTEYKVMLDKLKVLCPDSEVVLCQLPKSKLYSDETQRIYNGYISDYATEYGYKLIHAEDMSIIPYLIDSAHPYESGMDVIANNIISQLIK